MNRSLKFVLLVWGVTTLGVFAASAYTVSTYESAFAATKLGEKEGQVTARFGNPTISEYQDKPFMRYATRPCEAPCAKRLWWEHPVFRGAEAWSIELDTEGQVVRTLHWVSP